MYYYHCVTTTNKPNKQANMVSIIRCILCKDYIESKGNIKHVKRPVSEGRATTSSSTKRKTEGYVGNRFRWHWAMRPQPAAVENGSFSWAVDFLPAPPPNFNNNAATTTCRPYHHHHTSTTTVPANSSCMPPCHHWHASSTTMVHGHPSHPPLILTPKPPLQEAETPNMSIHAQIWGFEYLKIVITVFKLYYIIFIKPAEPVVAGVGWVRVACARPVPVPIQPIPGYPRRFTNP